MDGNLISGMKAIEKNMSVNDRSKLLRVAERLPLNHPLRDEVINLQNKLGVSIDFLPDKHPLILALKRLSSDGEVKKDVKDKNKPAKVKKVKKQEVKKSDNASINSKLNDELQIFNLKIKGFEEELVKLFDFFLNQKKSIKGHKSRQADHQMRLIERNLIGIKRMIESCSFDTKRIN